MRNSRPQLIIRGIREKTKIKLIFCLVIYIFLGTQSNNLHAQSITPTPGCSVSYKVGSVAETLLCSVGSGPDLDLKASSPLFMDAFEIRLTPSYPRTGSNHYGKTFEFKVGRENWYSHLILLNPRTHETIFCGEDSQAYKAYSYDTGSANLKMTMTEDIYFGTAMHGTIQALLPCWAENKKKYLGTLAILNVTF